MKILVTGANGYLGRGVVTSLLDKGIEVVATDFSVEKVDARAKKYSANLFDVDNPYEFFESPDVLLHMAWRDGFVHFSDNHIIDLPLHYRFIKRMTQAGIKRVCIMGSMHEIGYYEGCIDESTYCNPISQYGISKNALRTLSKILCEKEKIDWQWLRGYYIVGNDPNGSSIFSKIIKANNNGSRLFPFTSGQNKYDFLDYKDFCYYVAIAVTQSSVKGIINIASGKPVKLSDRVEKFIKDNALQIELQYGVFPERPYDSKAIWGNNEKLLTILKHMEETHEQ